MSVQNDVKYLQINHLILMLVLWWLALCCI